MKQLVTNFIIGILTFGSVYFIWIRPEYTWSQILIDKHKLEGWKLISSETEISVSAPWTWVYPPIKDLRFIKESFSGTLSRNPIQASEILVISYRDRGTEYYQSIIACDCINKRSMYIDSEDDFKRLKESKIKWINGENEFSKFLCKNIK